MRRVTKRADYTPPDWRDLCGKVSSASAPLGSARLSSAQLGSLSAPSRLLSALSAVLGCSRLFSAPLGVASHAARLTCGCG